MLRALVERLPQSRFVFIGDTARLPYGSKSRRTIARYAVESTQFLAVREQGAEFLVIACNTASALALDAIVKEAAPVFRVLGVIDPGAATAHLRGFAHRRCAGDRHRCHGSEPRLCGCMRCLGPARALEKVSCPCWFRWWKRGWTDPPAFPTVVPGHSPMETAQAAVTEQVFRIYLDELLAEAAAKGMQPDTLVLGCTHYPLLRPLIERNVPAGMKVIDSAEAAAEAAVQLINHGTHGAGAGDSRATDIRMFCHRFSREIRAARLPGFLGQPSGTRRFG